MADASPAPLAPENESGDQQKSLENVPAHQENEEEEQDEAPTDRYIYPPLLNLYFQQAQPLPDLEGPDLPLAPTHPKELTPELRWRS
ncbi:hypothetical protein PAPYR_12323 [Paratrimastix pyriformis]|uniref:Uncharacterized protein n=1 Tax=Paratrimastix pyriformis TaxID=342808 RepID=A0ABQ8U226_9EUKA|nr:hypothetical protein PAPYR_12323 [Paratrimastix pyriformis]